MKKVLIIENAARLEEEMFKLQLHLVKKDYDVQFISHAAQSTDEIAAAFKAGVDILAFQTTFLNDSQNTTLVNMLKKLPAMEVWIYHHDLKSVLERYVLDVEEIYETRHHKIFEINPIIYTHREGHEEGLKLVDFSKEIAEYQSYLDEVKETKIAQGKRFTGRKVVIGDLHAWGKQWSTLKKGDVVDELVRPENDPQPTRGIWVNGLSEPVKLINEGGAFEYRYYGDLSLEDMVEIFCLTSRIANPTIGNTRFIESVILDTEMDNLSKAQEVLDEYGVERRWNRSFLADTLKQLKNG